MVTGFRDISRSVNIFAKNIQKDVILTANFLPFLKIYLKKKVVTHFYPLVWIFIQIKKLNKLWGETPSSSRMQH